MRTLAALLLVGLTFPSSSRAQERDDEPLVSSLRSLARQLAGTGDFAGEVLLAHDGRILYHEALGEIDPIKHVAAKVGDQYNIASVGKIFTGSAIMQLVASGRLSLDDTLGRFLADSVRPRGAAGVRLRHILSHTSGMRRGSDTLAFQPGSKFEYSNYGFFLLGKLLETVTGMPFAEHFTRTLFAPNGMTSTFRYVEGTGRQPPPPGFAISRDAGGRLTFEENPVLQSMPATGAGGFYSTAQDLFRFAEALRLGKVVPLPLVDSMRTPKTDLGAIDYGYGIDRFRGGNIWGNTGFIPGANADLEFYGDSGYLLVVVSNRAANEPIRQHVASRLAAEPFKRDS